MYNENMGKPVRNAFTLVELLVVIAIMAILSVFTLANYKDFGEDQKLKNAVLDIQSTLRQAQASATANTECTSGEFGTTWQVYFNNDGVTTNLRCQLVPFPLPDPSPAPTAKKNFQSDASINIQEVSGNPSSSCPNALPFTVRFAPLTGRIIFIGYDDNTDTDIEMPNCTLVTVTLQNTKTSETKSLTIEQGGQIYVQ